MLMRLAPPAMGALGLALCLTLPAWAQAAGTPVGTVDATIDKMAYAGETLDVPSEGTSTAEYRSFGPVTSLTIQAHDPNADSRMHNVLSIEVSLMGSDASASIVEASVSWWPSGMSEPFYHSEGSEAELALTIDALSLEDGQANIAGSFSAQVCRKDGFFAEADMDDCLPVEGTFNTPLGKAD